MTDGEIEPVPPAGVVPAADADRSSGFDDILADYLLAAEAGAAPPQDEFLRRHPRWANELSEFFSDESEVARLAAPSRLERVAPADWADPSSSGTRSDAASGSNSAPPTNGPRIRYFGEYELLEEIGRGGMGVVYRARQVRLDRIVALKMILAGQFAGAEDVKRFQVEAENAARLDHPNIVPVYEVGRHRGQHYFSMRLIEGGSLSEVLPRFTSDHPAAAGLIATTARAVHYAHQRGILHRDLKPGNILLDREGHPQITDFGLARRMEAGDGGCDGGITITGAVLGSPRYMAPEQARGERGLTLGADVYSLGAVLYELVTGRTPFSAETVLETLRQVREREPPRPSSLLPGGLDQDLETICLKCLEKDPQRRYGSALALAEDLQRWLADEPISARPVGRAERAWRWCRRKPLAAALTAVATCLVVTVAVSGAWLVRSAGRERSAHEHQQQEARDHRAALSDSQMLSGLMADERGDPRQAALWFTYAARSASDDADRRLANRLRAQSWTDRLSKPVAALPLDPSDRLFKLAFSPDGAYLLTLTNSGRWAVWDWASGSEHPMKWPADGGDGGGTSLPSKASAISWRPDGGWLAVAPARAGGGILLYAFPSGQLLQQVEHRGDVQVIAFSPEGRYLAIGGQDSARVWDCVTNDFVTPELPHPALVWAITFGPRSDRLVTACADGQVRVFRIPTPGSSPPNSDGNPDAVNADAALLIAAPHVAPAGATLVAPAFTGAGLWLLTSRVGTVPRGSGQSQPEAELALIDADRGLPSPKEGQSMINPDWANLRHGLGMAVADTRSHFLFLGGIGEAQAWVVSPSGKPQRRARWAHPANRNVQVAISSANKWAITVCNDSFARLWPIPDSEPGADGIGTAASPTLPGTNSLPPPGFADTSRPLLLPHQAAVYLAALSPDERLAATVQEGNLVRVWAIGDEPAPAWRRDRSSASGMATPMADELRAPLGAASRNGRFYVPFRPAAGVGLGREVAVLDAATGNVAGPLMELGVSQDIDFSPDGARIAVACTEDTGGVSMWDWRSGRRLWRADDVPAGARRVRYSPDGRYVAVLWNAGLYSDRSEQVFLLDAVTGGILGRYDHGASGRDSVATPHFVQFSADSRTLITWGKGDTHVRIRDSVTGEPRFPPLQLERPCVDLRASSDGKLIAIATDDGTVRVWSFDTGQPMGTPLYHSDTVSRICFDSDGARLLTACSDGVARIWDWRSGAVVALMQHDSPVIDAVFAGVEERWIVTVGEDNTERLWEAATFKPLTPTVPLGGYGWVLHVSNAGEPMLMGGNTDHVQVLRPQGVLPGEAWEPADLCLRGEVVSGQLVHEGGGISNLPPAEWLDRWRVLRRRHPEFPELSAYARAAGPRGMAPSERLAPQPIGPGDWPMYGGTPSRNLLSPGKAPPTQWDVKSGQNIVWRARLGSQSYGSPIIAGGVVYVGSNNEAKRDPQHLRDGGVLTAFDETAGRFLWQRYVPKLPAGRVNDWPYQGQCGTVYAEPGRIWYCTNRCETICLDVSRPGEQPRVLWRVDMMGELGVFPHNMTRCHIAARGNLIYVITANGVDETHKNVPAPDAPSIVCFDKNTGRVVWSDNSPGSGILHGQWASVAIAEVGGRGLVIAPLGDGWVYAYDAETGKVVWKFDCNRKGSIYPRTRNELLATPVIYKNRMYLATGQDPEHGEGPGLIWCVDITREGDISAELAGDELPAGPDPVYAASKIAQPRKATPNPNSAVVWQFESFDANGDGKIRSIERMNRSTSTVAIANGLVFAADFSGYLHCFDAETGTLYWTHDMEAAMWEGALAVDGKVYLCDEDGDVAVFEAAKALKLVATNNMESAIYTVPVYANGVLYVMTKDELFAIRGGDNLAQPASMH